MKRLLWLTCLCSFSSLMLAACGGSSSKKMSDGGISDGGSNAPAPATDLKGVNDQLSKLSGRADGLDNAVNDLTTKTKDIGSSVDALAKRVKTLETPPDPVSCSATESCIPDGIDLARSGLVDLVNKICSYEIGCCTPDELSLKFGPAIKTLDDCVSTFTDLVNNGFTPNFLNDNGPLINTVIRIAQAFNNPDVKIEIDAKAVTACITELDKRECNKYVAPQTITTQNHCKPVQVSSEDDPCSVTKLINGLQATGELCGIYPGIPECMDGLICREVPSSDKGLCANPSKAGDHCTSDTECDQGLFCNFGMGKCQALAGDGDPCAYIDPAFEANDNAINPSFQGNMSQGQALSIKCMPGYSCDPASKKCVDNCNDGSLCSAGDQNGSAAYDCPDGLICNVTENPGLRTTWSMGVCRSPAKVDAPCSDQRYGSECASGRCGLNTAGDVVCQAPLKKPGDACTLAGQDVLCSSGFCGTDSKCTSECNTYDSALGRYTGCPTGFYCEVAQSTPGGYACEPLVANAAPCGVDGSSGHHDTCSSGFCNGSQCAAKVAADAACPSNADQECPSTQFCDISLATHICVTLIAKDAACTTAQGDHACGATATGNYCYYNGTAYLCRVPGDEDASCVLSGRDCKPTLTCTSDNKCHAQGKYPDGVNCQGSQTACASSWCSGNGATATPYVCKSPIADGDDCDTTDTTKNRCSDASYCKFAAGEHAGKCTAKGSAGQACEPRFNGVDCLSHFSLPTAHPPSPGMCSLKSDSFVCDSTATASDQVMCHGK